MKNKNIIMTKEIEQKMEADPTFQPIETHEKLHNVKPKDMTRRELLSSGIIPFAASIVPPTFLTAMAANNANAATAEECQAVAAAPLSPLLTVSCAGGAPLGGEWLPRDQSLSLLTSYSLMGGGRAPGVDQEFKADTSGRQATFFMGSSFLTGIRAVASAETLLATHFIGFCGRAGDDTAMNKQGIGGMAAKAGLAGELIKTAGTSATQTGGSHQFAMVAPPPALRVGSTLDVRGAVGFQNVLTTLSPQQQTNMMRKIASLSSHQATNLVSQSGGAVLQRLMGCANSENAELIANQDSLDIDPRANARVGQLWQLQANTPANSAAMVKATLSYLVLKGQAATATIAEGGCDGHNGTRATMDARMLNIGMEVGRILEAAVALRKKLFLYITTDGGMTGPESNVAGSTWTSDRGLMGCAYVIAYDPDQNSKATTTQVGWFTNGQAAADSFVWGSDVERMSAAVFLNYLSFNNQMGLLESVIGRKFESHEIDKIRVLFAS